MTRISRVILLLLAGLATLAPPGRADLLDEDPSPGKTTGPTTSPPSPPPGKAGSPMPPKKVEPPVAPPVQEPKKPPATTKPASGETNVLPPKNPPKPRDPNKKNLPVHFESKGLNGLRDKGTVELESDVVVTQGDLRLEADHAQVFFEEANKEVVKVIADGNVKIFNVDENTGEKLKAFGNQVVFLNRERTVVLEGNARLWRGEDSVIRGKKITYEMETGWIRADRVAGELAPPGEKPK